jgi:hypothetical protein
VELYVSYLGRAELRPDFVVESGGGALVLDAK